MARISNAVSRSIDRESIDGQSGDITQPGNTIMQNMFSKYTKSDFEIGLVHFFKDDCTDLSIFIIYI